MTLNESNTVEAHLRDLFAGSASARRSKLSPGLARMGGNIAGLGCYAWFPKTIGACSTFEGVF